MGKREAVVIGASAGGIEALSRIIAGLPRDFSAAIFVVIHIPSDYTSVLPRILNRAGTLEAEHAHDGDNIRGGRIYIAPPDRHLIIEDSRVRTIRGPRENNHRPAVDPLFRTAARTYGNKLIGIVLSGNLDDGTAGLQVVKAQGGMTIVQDPHDALHPGMPKSAIENVPVDYVLRTDEIAPTLVRLVADSVPDEDPSMSEETEKEIDIEKLELKQLEGDDQPGVPSGFTCPECHGGLWEIREGKLVRYRCRVGHAFSADTLLTQQGEMVEAALWAALRALEENAAFARRLARRHSGDKLLGIAQRYKAQATRLEDHAKTLRDLLLQGPEGSGSTSTATAGN